MLLHRSPTVKRPKPLASNFSRLGATKAFGTATLFSALLLLHSAASGAWKLINDEIGFREYADIDAVERLGKIARIWTLIDYEFPIGDKPAQYRSTKQLFEFDCSERRMRTLVFRNYSLTQAGGAVVTSKDRPDPWEYIEPDGGLLKYREIACTKLDPRSK
jgi:hypothetical protein